MKVSHEKVKGTSGTARRLPRHLTNVVGLTLFAVLVVLLPAGAEDVLPPPSSASVWYAAGASLVRVDAENGQATGSAQLSTQTSPVSGLASHPTDGSIAVLAKGRLLGFDGSATKTFEEPVAAASSLGSAPVLSSDPHDGRLWVGGSGVIVLADARGQNQRTLRLNTGEVVKVITASQGGGAYALTQSRLLRLSKAGELISQRPMSKVGVKSPTYLAVDEYGGLGYVANATVVAQVSLGKPGDPPILKTKPNGGVAALSVNPFDGTLYAASRPSRKGTVNLYAYDDGNGLLQKKVSFQALAVRTLSFDTPSQTLWAGTDAKVLGFQKDLSPKAQIAAAGLNALAAAPLSLSSQLSLLEPQNGGITNNTQQQVRLHLKAFCNNETCPAGFTYGSRLALEATLNGQEVGNLFHISGDPGAQDGAEATYTPQTSLPEGENKLVAEAADPFGVRSNNLEASFTVDTTGAVDTKPPTISGVPSDIVREATDPSGVKVSYTAPTATDEVDGEVPVNCDPPSGSTFPTGTTTVTCTATDKVGNEATASFNVTVEEATTALDLSITEPEEGSTVRTDTITVKGTVTGPSGTKVTVAAIEATLDSEGNFTAEGVPLTEGQNAIVVTATSPSDQSVAKTLNVTYEPAVDPGEPPVRSEDPPDSPLPAPGPLPPDPEQIAPPVDASTATDTAEATRFLYEGENAVQTGVEEGTINEQHVAVLRGKVSDRTDNPVPGVRITVLDHPELGQTLTREDGRFDIAVNGGGTVTLSYEKDHYMPAQRQVEAPWRDFAAVEDVVLVGFSRKVTDVDLEGTDEMLVAQGSSITDADGTRQSTVLLPGDTQAEMVMPDGTTRPLPEMDFRATEYTVGEDGPEAMPAALPPASGYTYAVELSADEAVEVGASEVRFTKPVYNYVENFLGFPVGTDVPNGYYDKERAAWVPSEDGRVIKVLSITDGLADLDVKGGGTAADAATLQGLGITDEERAKLAGLYAEGQSLWRVPIDHFTPWDHNWPYGPPDDAKRPDQPPAPDPGAEPKPECEAGSVIECQNQILGENLNVLGTPFSLHYGSDGVPGRKVSRTLDIPLIDDIVPPSLKRIELEVFVAGQRFKKSFSTEPNQSYTYAWDGKDAYGRTITGEKNVTYRVGYVYGLVYQEPADFAMSFAGLSGVPFTDNRTEREITLWQDGEGKVASLDDRGQGMGGWTPDILHQYDPEGRTLRLGNGDRRRGDTIGRTITTVAGNGSFDFSGDGGPAKDASLSGPRGVAVGPDGTLYIADTDSRRVRKVSPDGIISTVAGNGSLGFSGDGGPAKDASLNEPEAIAVGPDGTLYIADLGNNRVRKVSPDGIISTVAGNGSLGFSGDGGPAKDASLARPRGVAVGPDGTLYIADLSNNRVRKVSPDGIISTVAGNGSLSFSGDGGPAKDASVHNPSDVAVDPDGTLYIADLSNNRVRKVSPDGIISTVAGSGQAGFSGDGGPAEDARLYAPRGVAVGPDGTLYIADFVNNRVRKVSPDGIISTVAGNGSLGFSGDGGPAKDASLSGSRGVAVGPDGTLYIADFNKNRVRNVTSPMPGPSASAITVPSEDGTQLYHFDHKGKHLRTLDSVTGTVLYRFSYDGQGRLTAVEDMDGLTTSIGRDASGNATAIVAPNGERTELSLDANGYLASVSNPAQETVQLTYDGEGGLLESLTDPKNNTTRFTYDAQGHLTKDEDPAGGYKALSRTSDDADRGNFTVSVGKASGRKNTYAVEKLPDGSTRRLNTDASGLKTEKIIGTDGDEKVTTPDGTVVETSLGPDPRFGMQSPVVDQATLKTPGGRSMTIKTSRQATLAHPSDPLSAPSITEKVQIGARAWTSTFDKTANTIKSTSPEGRSVTTTLDAKGRPVLLESPGSAPESYEYDQRGRLAKVTTGTGTEARTTTYAYDEKDRVSSVTDASGKEWRFEYDAAGRLTRQTSPSNRSVSYSYDKNGNLTSLTPPGRSAHEFAYDSRNLATSYSAPQVGVEERTASLERDLDRLPTSKTLPGGGRIEYSYDAGGRPTMVHFPGGEKSYTYNPTTGNVATMSNSNGTLSNDFDGSLPISETSGGQVPGKVELKYGPDLRVSSISVNGTEVPYTYDNDDLISKAGSLNVSRDAQRGLVSGTTLSGTTDQRSYNTFGEPDSYEALSGTTQLYKTSYERDSLGRITEKTETVKGTSTTYAYSYDDEGRLKEVRQDGEVVASYAYDENGNRLSRTTSSGTTEGSYDAQDRLTSYGENEYIYAPDGYLESKTDTGTDETTSYTHDAMGNLLSATLPDGRKIEYVVDARDRRVGKKVNGQLVQGFLYQGQLSPAAELNEAGNVVSRFVYATKGNVPDYMEKGGKTYRIISDQLGSVRLVVDAATGEVAQRLDYDEFGQVINDTNPGFQPFGYAGGLYDEDTKLTRFGTRDYDAEVGRWTAKDPIMFAGGTNLYAYAHNDPINFVDPDGHNPVVAGIMIVVFILSMGMDAPSDTSQAPANLPGMIGDVAGLGALPAAGLALAESGASKVEVALAESALAERGASEAGMLEKLNADLAKQEASGAQMCEKGTPFAGPGGRASFRDAQRIADTYGGNPADWAKKSSSNFRGPDGTFFETHWVENVHTGQRVEYKTKFLGGK